MTLPLRVLILTPTAMPSITGNALTVERWRISLEAQGVSVSVLPTKGMDPSTLLQEFNQLEPDLVHVHHAFRAAALLLNPKIESAVGHIPLVVSPGGTDLNVDWFTESGRSIISRLCSKARVLITQSDNLSQLVKTNMPQFADRVVKVSKSFLWFGHEPFDLRGAAQCAPRDVLFFMPAGLRPVKGNLEFLLGMVPVLDARQEIRIIFAGNPLDNGYADKLYQEVNRLAPRVTWIPAIAPAAMRAAYDAADIVVNASSSEGLSNAILEAMAAGRAVLASNIHGNRYPLIGNNGDKPAGLLYTVGDSNDLQSKALRLIDDATFRDHLGNAGIVRTAQFPTPEQEADNLLRIYEKAIHLRPHEKYS